MRTKPERWIIARIICASWHRLRVRSRDWRRGWSSEDFTSLTLKLAKAEPGQLVPITQREFRAMCDNSHLVEWPPLKVSTGDRPARWYKMPNP